MSSRALTTLHTFYSAEPLRSKGINPHSQRLNLSEYYVSLSVRRILLRNSTRKRPKFLRETSKRTDLPSAKGPISLNQSKSDHLTEWPSGFFLKHLAIEAQRRGPITLYPTEREDFSNYENLQ